MKLCSKIFDGGMQLFRPAQMICESVDGVCDFSFTTYAIFVDAETCSGGCDAVERILELR